MSKLLEIGELFDDKYDISDILGSGGIGTVYLAVQRDCNRVVALKVLHDHAAEDAEYRARFIREARALSKIQHKNIVNVYHLGLLPDGVPYLVMEYVRGKNVRVILNAAGRMSALQSLAIIGEAARALYYVHVHDITHRDLKPENIMITDLPEANTVKIVDFGLARLDSAVEQKLTKTGELIGTSAYMSPEQCMGKPVDFRSDIYSLSVCLYEMLVGKKPFDADTAVGCMYKHINEEVPSISHLQVDLFHPALNELVRRGMAKDPQQRFAGMNDMADEIDRVVLQLRSNGKGSPAMVLPLPATILIFLLIAMAGAAFWLRKNQQPQSKITIHTSASTEKANLHESKDQMRERLYKSYLQECKRHAGRDRSKEADTLVNLANLYASEGRFKEAEPLCQRALSIRENWLPIYPVLASAYIEQCRYAEAEALLERGLAVRKGKDWDHLAYDNCLAVLAKLKEKQGKFAEAEAVLKQSLASIEELFGPDQLSSTRFLIQLAKIKSKEKEYAEAEALLKHSIRIKENTYGPDDRSVVESSGSNHLLPVQTFYGASSGYRFLIESFAPLAQLYLIEGKQAEAERLLKRSLTIIDDNELGMDVTGVEDIFAELEQLYLEQGKAAEAKALCLQEQAIVEKELDQSTPQVAGYLLRQAGRFMENGKFKEAESLLIRSLSICEKMPPADQDPRAIEHCCYALGYCCHHLGRYKEAESYYRRALAIGGKVLGPSCNKDNNKNGQLAEISKNYALLMQRKSPLSESGHGIWIDL